MYNKFSIIEFTNSNNKADTKLVNGNTSPVQGESSSSSSGSSSIHQQVSDDHSNGHVNGQMQKKRGRPAKHTPSTQMIVKTTECFYQPVLYSLQSNSESWTSTFQKKRKIVEPDESILNTNFYKFEESYQTFKEKSSTQHHLQKKKKISNEIPQRNNEVFHQISAQQSQHTKPKIVRTSISIKELLN